MIIAFQQTKFQISQSLDFPQGPTLSITNLRFQNILMNKHLPGDVIERLEIFSVPVEVGGVEEVWGEVDDVTEGENFSRLFQDFALRHLHVASGLQVVAQELDGVDQLVETRKTWLMLSLNSNYKGL